MVRVNNFSVSSKHDFAECEFEFSKSEGDSTLALENIEALGSPEAGVGFKHCTQAGGYCFENGIKVHGISMKDE